MLLHVQNAPLPALSTISAVSLVVPMGGRDVWS